MTACVGSCQFRFDLAFDVVASEHLGIGVRVGGRHFRGLSSPLGLNRRPTWVLSVAGALAQRANDDRPS